jgi:hypothetical protein
MSTQGIEMRSRTAAGFTLLITCMGLVLLPAGSPFFQNGDKSLLGGLLFLFPDMAHNHETNTETSQINHIELVFFGKMANLGITKIKNAQKTNETAKLVPHDNDSFKYGALICG